MHINIGMESRGAGATPAIGRDGLQEVVDLLLKAGIDPSLTDTAGEPALAAAERFARSEVSSGAGESDMRDLVAILD